ncbi:bifunctional acetyl-CoA carboxylase/biotin carboxylase [Galdieria sulphuraria]|uniref:Bifunctional acetyl-CoA carboxylase/biotin carboxylase n=1 Tax=Galdieria sulphuraria TaxID=130081 RepID=M2X7M8_GALSU|nr:bifunctional acetyl-CoA carboxylase/biotin carboxylase [Galdieria sulphuraria]EME32530.1 bifunctional acetyl-CoA carboxylase/biotin carboxylase [Galdieria sulphuraria]|eukprot:XP_005709050.1 bifunctional acetyl-CoA carboxylase/biotin carboxylase [Galdieria sulphuraria]
MELNTTRNQEEYPIQTKNTIEEYVELCHGKRVIRKVLIANNGIAAVKAIRSMRKWLYEVFGNERLIEFVSMATPEDIRANAEYVRLADQLVPVPGGSNNFNYANVELIVDIAERFQVDAVWAGWGHASENPRLPERLSQVGVTFLGPNAAAMRALGDKISSTLLAQSVGVPVVPWSGFGVTVDYRSQGIPEEIFRETCIFSESQAVQVANEIGYPVMLKASEGGGGKGIRMAHHVDEINNAYRQVKGEVPGSPIFMMKVVSSAKHLEVQVVADEYGNAVALYGRDCSVQRRHQKMVEEGPVIAAVASLWSEMEQSAVRLAKEVGYCGAGTVEYLYHGTCEEGEFYFLELNPRLQVEHPVTEWITNLNLPAIQLQIAMGIPLTHIPSLRTFHQWKPFVYNNNDNNSNHNNAENIFAPERRKSPHGHVIAVRITAENPDEGFQPTSGAIQELAFRNTPNVWGYFSVGTSGGVHEYSDSQFGHLFAWGEDREMSRRNMVLALKELSIRGEIRTATEYIVRLLESEDFKACRVTTEWLDGLIASKAITEKPSTELAVIAGAVCKACAMLEAHSSEYISCLVRGQLPPKDLSLIEFPIELVYENYLYSFLVSRKGPVSFNVSLNGSQVDVEVRYFADGGRLLLVDGHSHVSYLREEALCTRLTLDGKTCVFPKANDPTQIKSHVNGKLVRYLVKENDKVSVKAPIAELEAMKMYITVYATAGGRVHLLKSDGASVEIGEILATLQLDDESEVKRPIPFQGQLPAMRPPSAPSNKPYQKLRVCKSSIQMIMDGYDANENCMEEFLELLFNPQVAFGEIHEVVSELVSYLPKHIYDNLCNILESLWNDTVKYSSIPKMESRTENAPQLLAEKLTKKQNTNPSIPSEMSIDDRVSDKVKQMIQLLDQHRSSLRTSERDEFLQKVIPLTEVLSRFEYGMTWFALKEISELLQKYIETEKPFSRNKRAEDVLFEMRESYKDDLSNVVDAAISHMKLPVKNKIILGFLDFLVPWESALCNLKGLEQCLIELSTFSKPPFADVALRARLLLARARRPSLEERKSKLLALLEQLVDVNDSRDEAIQDVLHRQDSHLDILLPFIIALFRKSKTCNDYSLLKTAVELHIHRAYRAYQVSNLTILEPQENDYLSAFWQFRLLPPGSAWVSSFHQGDNSSSSRSVRAAAISSYDSADNLTRLDSKVEEIPFRFGMFAIFPSFGDLVDRIDMVIDNYQKFNQVSKEEEQQVHILSLCVPWLDTLVSSPKKRDVLSQTSSEVEQSSNNDQQHFDNSNASIDPFALSLKDLLHSSPQRKERMIKAGIKLVTFIVFLSENEDTFPQYYTFRSSSDYSEDLIYRHIDPPMAFQLELHRMMNFQITRYPYPSHSIHVFYAQDKRSSKLDFSENKDMDTRFFVRSFIRNADALLLPNEVAISIPEAERSFAESLDALEMARCDRRFRYTEFNHIFLCVLPPVSIDSDEVEAICRRMFLRYAARCFKLRVFVVEVRVQVFRNTLHGGNSNFLNSNASHSANGAKASRARSYSLSHKSSVAWPLRFILFNPTGHSLKVEGYLEQLDPLSGVTHLMTLDPSNPGHLHGTAVDQPYQVMDKLQRKRVLAQTLETTYIYDFRHLFTKALEERWRKYSQERRLEGFKRQKVPSRVAEFTELILEEDETLKAVHREPGQNSIGMVAWRAILRTPEYPGGRDVIVIGSDITHLSGSLSIEEDRLFAAASHLASQEGIPRIYIAANSGARIGLAEEVRRCFKVDWVDEGDPSKGFRHFYVSEEDLKNIGSSVQVIAEDNDLIVDWNDSKRFMIKDIIGSEDGLGVENLVGSGWIAGETSAAYEQTFTITYVTARSVGIGAYLVRLGERVIQKENAAPIILTGFSALNKVLGHDVYVSNEQLGGIRVMFKNGVSQRVVKDDLAGVDNILEWLSFVPQKRYDKLPIIEPMDPVHREISFQPSKSPYDPRYLIAGMESLHSGSPDEVEFESVSGMSSWSTNTITSKTCFIGGFFDRGSWMEAMSGWAKTVICGRARLGGIPVGVIVPETRTMEKVYPADPASPETTEKVIIQAGQVWYPDSAFKTAQAIRDMNREGLPLFILANWRGFSGGMRDMYDEILKYGSMIVDALRTYSQPVFVYILPYGELRGGAWVVLDTKINSQHIEMYADETSRGGVLEPEGTIDVKYRKRELLKTMHRLDPQLQALDQELQLPLSHEESSSTTNNATSPRLSQIGGNDKRQQILAAIRVRESELMPIYRRIALTFADLHDTPGRMLAKKAIRKIVPWKEARSFFFWRLQRRLAEDSVRKWMMQANASLNHEECTLLLKKWAAQYRNVVQEEEIRKESVMNTQENELEAINQVFDEDDQWVVQWLDEDEEMLTKKIKKLQMEWMVSHVIQYGSVHFEALLEGVDLLLRNENDFYRRQGMIAALESRLEELKKTVNFNNRKEQEDLTSGSNNNLVEHGDNSSNRISNTLTAPTSLAKGLLSRFGYRWDAP